MILFKEYIAGPTVNYYGQFGACWLTELKRTKEGYWHIEKLVSQRTNTKELKI